MKEFETIITQARYLTEQLLKMNPEVPRCPDGFPEAGGVYCIRDIKSEVVYIGKAKNIRRRICIDHLSREMNDTMSAFRRSVNERHRIPFGPEMKEWIINNCRFSYLEIPDADMRSVVESLSVTLCRSETILNKF